MEEFDIKLKLSETPTVTQTKKLKNYFKEMPVDEIISGLKFANSRWIDKDAGLTSLHKLYPLKMLGLLRIPPNSIYDWHKDEYRLSTVNMLIKHDHSHCLFGKSRDNYYINITELSYQPYTYYLFNNQQYHSVLNFNKPRYLFSLYFDKELDYTSLKELLHPILL